MAFRPNYQQQRGERNRAKQLKKQERLRRREEETARRKAGREGPGDPGSDADAPATDAPETPREGE
jgi:hypothetical protein